MRGQILFDMNKFGFVLSRKPSKEIETLLKCFSPLMENANFRSISWKFSDTQKIVFQKLISPISGYYYRIYFI